MATPPTLHLRFALQTLKFQPSLIGSSRASAPHLTARQQISKRFLSTPSSRSIPQLKYLQFQSLRFASDTTTHPASTHPSASSAAASNPASIPAASTISPPSRSTAQEPTSSNTNPSPSTSPTHPSSSSTSTTTTLTWNTYLTLRRLRRRYSLLASLLTSATTTGLGLIAIDRNMDYLGSILNSIFGVDPIFMLAIALVATGGVGWLLGPFVGEGKEKDFYARIRKYRVDPSLASYSNPLPDYYGEKIGSVRDFRTWMRDQRAYNRKRMAV
ncbi:MAG: hypothetical protein Q9166_003373 [cf. Caloplaca sp. 2 TL-2023]